MNNLDKQEKARADRQRMRELLMREWDPIGIVGSQETEDEYDDYVATLQVMLTDRPVTQEEVEGHLAGVATDYIGLSDPPELRRRCHRTAAALFALDLTGVGCSSPSENP